MKWVLMNGCGHIEQPGRNKDVETSRYIETGACLIISVQRYLCWKSECASPTQVCVDTGYKT